MKKLLLSICAALLAATTVAGAPAAAAAAGCGGTLAIGAVAACESISGTQEHVYFVSVPKANDVLYTMLTRGSGESPRASVTGPTGADVCLITSDAGRCELKGAGTYKIVVSLYFGGTGDYTLGVQSLKSPSSCTTLAASFFSFASTGQPGSLPAGAPGDCFRFNQPTGSVLRLWAPKGNGDLQGDILDADLQYVCKIRYAQNCTLTGSGPYRLTLAEAYGNATPYTLRMSRISNAAGCQVLKNAPFGDPAAYEGTGSLPQQEDVVCHKTRVTAPGSLGVRIFDVQSISWTVYDDAGQAICSKWGREPCALPAAGDYTVISESQGWEPIDYRIAVNALARNTGCAAATGLSWAADALVVHQTSPVQTNCHPFRGTAGDRVVAYASPTSYNEAGTTIVDSTGAEVCPGNSEEDGCVLPATGTYRVVSYLSMWGPDATDETYKLQVRRLSQPAGCPVVRLGAYNEPPAGALGGIRCRTLVVTEPGAYSVRGFDDENYPKYGQLYDGSGLKVRADNLPAGRFTWVVDGSSPGVIDNDTTYVTSFLPAKPSGCPAAAAGTAWKGEYAQPGQVFCRSLDVPQGARLAQFRPTDGVLPEAHLLDGAGNYVCDSATLNQYSCPLNEPGPYTAVLEQRQGVAPGAFATAFTRVDGTPDCPALPAGGTTVQTGADRFTACFSIPADQHGATEKFTYQRTSGAGTARLSVFTADGVRYCRTGDAPERTVTCTTPAGPLTVVLEGPLAGSEFRLTRG
ncbi:hypothetical protein Aab01nite_52160 [Paractinoplanes abujensis]|uniref:Uncharacterized protein n=1 Tax=Paractinoplanes abujensis TaxID=882441 RepID=A0A7W7CS67_9ACTN|nr:hypothetical protein [Actinoplanes abujensis]MBB4693717.1 hypothetical protein [Actinoplanes abujensis]GID21626.1 hypothetical protein Aab01nite_52160 [Actinoplanes abujensis]